MTGAADIPRAGMRIVSFRQRRGRPSWSEQKDLGAEGGNFHQVTELNNQVGWLLALARASAVQVDGEWRSTCGVIHLMQYSDNLT